jgi:hypothetical protein
MAPADRTTLVCPDCGASNRGGEKSCFLCGQSLETTWTTSRAGARESSAPDTYAGHAKRSGAANAFSERRPTFQISSLMLLIAVIAVCAGVWRAGSAMGITLAVAVLPALLYTNYVAFESATAGRPMDVFEKVGSFVAALAGVVVVGLAAVIAFCMTCFPAGIVSRNIAVGLVIGGTAAIAAAAFVTRSLLSRRRGARWGR